MLNFTGSTKKRVVNLGDDRRGPKGRSFLEQAKKDRHERELTRQREKSAITLQRYIIKLLGLRRVALEMFEDWLHIGAGTDIDRWCMEALFISRFGSNSLLNAFYASIFKVICDSNGCLSATNVSALVKTLNRGLARCASPHVAMKCLSKLLDMYPIPNSNRGECGSIIENVMRSVSAEDYSEAVGLSFKVNLADSPEAFVNFLAKLEPSSLVASIHYWNIVSTAFENEGALHAFATLPGFEQVSLLLNLLKLHSTKLEKEDALLFGKLIARMSAAILPETHGVASNEISLSSKVVVSTEDYSRLTSLQSASYVRLIFEHFSQVDVRFCATFMTQLCKIFPASRMSLCMIMSITPGLPAWLHELIANSPQYDEYCKINWSSGISKFKSYTENGLFDDLICTYSHVLSSWLVVSKDTESFQSDNFPLEGIIRYCFFLKSFCFCLLKQARGERNPQREHLTGISFSVLNQLYTKNLRLSFLPKSQWKIDGFELQQDMVLQNQDKTDEESSDDESEVPHVVIRPCTRETMELEILNRAPFFVDFTTRVKILQNSIRFDKTKFGPDANALFFSDDLNSHKLSADINRESILDDAFASYFKVGENFKNPLKVTFYNEHGPEAGIDGGGLTKEFLTSVVEEGFSPNNELRIFKESSSYGLYPNDDVFWKSVNHIDIPTQRKRLMYTKFLGMIIGKCLYEGILIDVNFAPFFLSKWRIAQTNSKNSIDDLVYLDPELYSNLNKLLDMSDQQLTDLDINFTVNEVIENKTYSYHLQPDSSIPEIVNGSNRLSYIHKVSDFKLNQSLRPQTNHFLDGLFQVIRPNWLNMFDPIELQMLISGGNDIDLQDWKSNVQYGGYFDDDITIDLFWEVVDEMSPQERCDLVKFVTSVSRAPLLGFGVMYPKFGISNAGSSDRLPTASTCLNLLKLPDYKDKTLIREKLLYSIHANSGFDLS